jgi:hypothetical protein
MTDIEIAERPYYFATSRIEEPDIRWFPSIMQTLPAPQCGIRYRQVPTIDVVNHLRERAFKVTSVVTSRLKTQAGEYGLHMVRMRQEHAEVKAGGTIPELVITNSHNGTRRCVITLGLHRVACDNGLICGSAGQFSRALTHVGDIRQQVLAASDKLLDSYGQLGDRIDRWDRRVLTAERIWYFTRDAMALRFAPGDRRRDSMPWQHIAGVRRAADEGNSLWKVFNRVQEALVVGGTPYRSSDSNQRRKPRNVKLRPITAPGLLEGFNRALWDLAENYYGN